MEYNFGPDKPKFSGTDEEWNKLKQKFAKLDKQISIYPFINVICPHCGSKNTHICDGTCRHRECHLDRSKISIKLYDCPGYYVNTPK
jgi:hypothetical protein